MIAHVGIVPARGGSKRIIRKNIRECAGEPLLAWTSKAALASRLDRVILSTDDAEIADIGRRLGLDVPFLRPVEAAGDEAPMLAVLTHLVTWLESSGSIPSSIVLLQPTSPLRLSRHIDEALDLFESNSAESVVSVMALPSQVHPRKWMKQDAGGVVTGCDSEVGGEVVVRNGPAVLVTSTEAIKRNVLYGTPTLGYRMEREYSIDIDDEFDFAVAEALLLRRQRNLT